VGAEAVSEEAILEACERGDVAQFRHWGQQGIKVESAEPLCAAALHGAPLDVLRCMLIEMGADAKKGRSKDGATPLLLAAQRGDLGAVRCLLNFGAKVNQSNNDGTTALMAASIEEHAEVVAALIKAGATAAGASAYQTAGPEAKSPTQCSSSGCSKDGVMKCTRCKRARYCGRMCQLAHWKAHKADCKRWGAGL
jgi:hypothetical protein